jgi:hypothetical protein
LNVTAGSHQLRLAKMNDGSKGEALVQNIALSSGGRCSSLPSRFHFPIRLPGRLLFVKVDCMIALTGGGA